MINFYELPQKISEDAKRIWPDFQLVAYALYNNETIFLFNHPAYPTGGKPYYEKKRDNVFHGADTLILYEEYPTAIVNLEFHHDAPSIYATLLHELFHGLQYLHGEDRFPDEMKGATYPLLHKNVELRTRELEHLYCAVIARSEKEKIHHLQTFINLRENRRVFMQPYIDYELAVETVEGPAFYVELQAYQAYTRLPFQKVFKKFRKDLTNKSPSLLTLRRCCYLSGLYTCLALDDIFPDWKKHLFSTRASLFDLLKERIDWTFRKIEDVAIREKTIEYVENIKQHRKKQFSQFAEKPGYHIVISGNMFLKSFDPMNMIVDGEKQLHTTFLKVEINNQEYLFNRPVIAYYRDKTHSLYRLHLVSENEPIIENGKIFIHGLGELQGNLREDKGIYYLDLCSS